MSWTRKPLAEVADFCLGKMLDENKNRGQLLPYLANINVRWGNFDIDDLRQMRFEEKELDRFGLKPDDIVMCEGGEPGRCAIWQDQLPGMMFQKALHRIRPHDCIDSRFLFYLFLKMGRNDEFLGLFTGSTIKHLPKEKLAKVVVAFPKIDVQKRIAATLSGYDDLIENNRRRIALLEQAARLLYEERFVRFRFPGHELIRKREVRPEQWRRKFISEIVTTQYGYTDSASVEPIGPKFLRGTDINKTSYIDWDSVPYCSDRNLSFEQYALRPNDILVIRMADPGKVAIVEQEIRAVFASYLVRLQILPDAEVHSLYLFYVMASPAYSGYISGSSEKSTRKSASAPLLTNFEIRIPPPELQQQFVDTVGTWRKQINLLLRQNGLLVKARDLLLPRLMSGEVEV